MNSTLTVVQTLEKNIAGEEHIT